jgi:hypothetical protein
LIRQGKSGCPAKLRPSTVPTSVNGSITNMQMHVTATCFHGTKAFFNKLNSTKYCVCINMSELWISVYVCIYICVCVRLPLWSEFLAKDPEVPGSLSSATRFSE